MHTLPHNAATRNVAPMPADRGSDEGLWPTVCLNGFPHDAAHQFCYRRAMDCFMCALDPAVIVGENDLAKAVADAYPVSPGHTLILTKRHVETWFDATRGEQHALLELLDEIKMSLDQQMKPDGYNIGFNVGTAAGQTIAHLHVHLIPRFSGDVDDPTGGVRLVIPDRGNYHRAGFVPSSTNRGKP